MSVDINRNIRKVGFITAFAIIMTAFLCIGCTAADITRNQAKTQVLVYLVGSDLESGSNTATDDINSILDTYKDTDVKTLDIIVAFGGADKDGWRGMKIATIEQLKSDVKDGKFGNGQYLYSDPGADMGSGQSLLKFLRTAQELRTANRTILIISDHGASYDGIGVDEITSNSLHMNDIDTALKETGITYDPILFDACLMSSLEVGKTVQPYTHLMLGSEEIQWGSYDYEIFLEALTASPEMDSLTLSQKIADSYTSQTSDSQIVLTMSIINVKQVPAIRESLDALGAKLVPLCDDPQGLHDLKSAYNDAISLGVSDGSAPTSVDLVSLLENIKKKRPELSADIDRTTGLVKQAVVFERHNSYSKAVAGISIASPDAMDPAKYKQYGEGVKIAPNWDTFFQKILAESSRTSAVHISSSMDQDAVTSAEAEAGLVSRSKATLSRPLFIGKGNGTFELRDPYNAARVFKTYYKINGSTILSIGSQPISPDPNGLYQLPQWDGRWYYFADQKAGTDSFLDTLTRFLYSQQRKTQPLLVDMNYDDVTVGGSDIYYSWVSFQDKSYSTNATLITYVNSTRNQNAVVIAPYTVTETGDALFGDSMKKFPAGSLVTSWTSGFDVKMGNVDEYTLSHTTAVPEMNMEYTLLPDGTYAVGIMAYYDNDDEVLADQFRILTIKNGAVISSTIEPLPRAG